MGPLSNMWNTIKALTHRKFTPRRRKFGRLGITGAFAVGALLVIVVAAWLVDRRGASAPDRRLVALAESSHEDPLDLLTRAARANRIVFLSDIHNATSPKRLAAHAVPRIAATSGLDAIAIEVGSDQQPYIDAYLDRSPEDASVLLSHPKTIGEPGSATRAFLDLYHAVWQLNEKLGADQRIRIVAADLPGWPLAAANVSGDAAGRMGKRDEQMQNVIENIIARIPNARILIFMSGLHGLKRGSVLVQSGGSEAVTVTPLAERLTQQTDEVYTFLVDAPSSGLTTGELAPYVGTRVAEILARANVNKSFGATIGSEFDYLKQPIVEKKTPGIEYSILPRAYKLRDAADGYLYLQ